MKENKIFSMGLPILNMSNTSPNLFHHHHHHHHHLNTTTTGLPLPALPPPFYKHNNCCNPLL